MLISDDKRFLFIHVPRTGGTSVAAALQSLALARPPAGWASLLRCLRLPCAYRRVRFGRHCSLRSAQALLPAGLFASCFKFAFVRDPWDRIASAYAALLRDPNHRRHRRAARLGFGAYVEREAPRVLKNQVDLLVDSTGRLGVDFVGRFETLAQDFAAVCERLGARAELPHLNGGDRRDYRSFYDGASRDAVRRHWSRDIDAFGYEF